MLRHPFAGHRRYSITHRAVQRLRELVPTVKLEGDEDLRDRLDEALSSAEDAGRATRTIDAMLGEPQTLIAADDFGEILYAIIKEDTVVTVLPRSHGEEILQRGLAMEARVAARRSNADVIDTTDRRRPRRDNGPVVVERIVRGSTSGGAVVSRIESVGAMEPSREPTTVSAQGEPTAEPVAASVLPMGTTAAASSPAAASLRSALRSAKREAAVAALREVLADCQPGAPLLPLWNELAQADVPQLLTVGDLIDAARG